MRDEFEDLRRPDRGFQDTTPPILRRFGILAEDLSAPASVASDPIYADVLLRDFTTSSVSGSGVIYPPMPVTTERVRVGNWHPSITGAEGDPCIIELSEGIWTFSLLLPGRFWGKLTSHLAAGSQCNPTIATFDAWVPDPDDSNVPPRNIQSTDPGLQDMVLVNRDADLTADAGRLIKVEWLREWSIYWLGRDRECSSSSSSSQSAGSGSSVSGSGSASGSCGCITVVTAVSCSGGGLSVTTGQARGCC